MIQANKREMCESKSCLINYNIIIADKTIPMGLYQHHYYVITDGDIRDGP